MLTCIGDRPGAEPIVCLWSSTSTAPGGFASPMRGLAAASLLLRRWSELDRLGCAVPSGQFLSRDCLTMRKTFRARCHTCVMHAFLWQIYLYATAPEAAPDLFGFSQIIFRLPHIFGFECKILWA